MTSSTIWEPWKYKYDDESNESIRAGEITCDESHPIAETKNIIERKRGEARQSLSMNEKSE